MRTYATRILDKWTTRGGEQREAERFVLVQARNAKDAGIRSGMVLETFRPATAADEEEWSDICDQPLTDHEVEALVRLARRAIKQAGRSRLRRGQRDGFDMDMARSAMLNVVVGKLTRMGGSDGGVSDQSY